MNRTPNRLIKSHSPYLLQHAYNPVDWYEWGEEAFQKAKIEKKPILVSIGYSACHWCHVMEKESFENETIAKIMNEHFVCIKVDREERPDVDQIYMEAIHLMGLQGGWPLNVFLTSDCKPFYGGTYFRPHTWANLLQQIAKAYRERTAEIVESAEQFAQELQKSEVVKYNLSQSEPEYSVDLLHKMFNSLKVRFDKRHGGMHKAPKFAMPCIYEFLLRYYYVTENQEALQHVGFTLTEIAKGGIYDQIGGGFARYSVDAEWFVPHFEKMLYDNAQLIALYAQTFALTQDLFFKKIFEETIEFVLRELYHPESGAFYAALDADSEGVEGKFYCWHYDELQKLFPEDEFVLFCQYFQVIPEGNWEHGFNILHTKQLPEKFAAKHSISLEAFETLLQKWKKKLLEIRAQRVRPGLDNKLIASWNALMLKGLCEAYKATQCPTYKTIALKNAHWILREMTKPDFSLWHSTQVGKTPHIRAYLDDYAAVIDAFVQLYQITFDNQWIFQADKYAQYVIQNFYDNQENMFYYTDIHAEPLIARKKEIFDNVIPASNSMLARGLYKLGSLLNNNDYRNKAQTMLETIIKLFQVETQYLSNWAAFYAELVEGTSEIVIIGKDAFDFSAEITKYFIPHIVIGATSSLPNDLPIFEGKQIFSNQTAIYVCKNQTCYSPVFSLDKLKI
ncbi:MAG: thioredoxin domain-containing protein [Cytophagales bacterium]|nr:thioredoxin domain-containing protein [Cytophagales bacterium]MDW8384217.1 thioredoxin domain-containing protein [Flammeovirgaceae bacterium]